MSVLVTQLASRGLPAGIKIERVAGSLAQGSHRRTLQTWQNRTGLEEMHARRVGKGEVAEQITNLAWGIVAAFVEAT